VRSLLENPVLMFTALVTLYSPLASLSSYFPTVTRFTPSQQARLSLGLFGYVTVFALTALWVGEPLLELLGLSTAALTVTGGIALMLAGVPLMRGSGESEQQAAARELQERDTEARPGRGSHESESWRSVLFMPTTFPLTVGGTTFAILVCFRSQAASLREVTALSVAALAYAAVTAITLYLSGHLERRVSHRTRGLLERIAGILLTAIAVSLLASGIPKLVVKTLESLEKERQLGIEQCGGHGC
jgi:multiple antibiotic resistance protein